MCHHKSLNFVHTWKHIFTWEGVRLIWVWLNSPVYFIVSYKWNKVLEDQVTVCALHWKLVDVSKMYLQLLSIGKLWTTRATLKSTFLWSQTSLHGINIDTGLLPAGVQEGGGGETHWAPGLLPQAVRCCWRWVHFLVRFSNMDLQAIFRFEVMITLVTLEYLLVSVFSLLFRSSFLFRRIPFRWRYRVLLQKFCPSPGISSQGWWTLPLLRSGRWTISPGVSGKWEGGANIEWEAEGLTLAGQRLAESHALGGQVRVVLTHCSSSHFQLYLN